MTAMATTQRKPISTFWARRIRFGLKAGVTPDWWPVLLILGPTRRAFDRSFNTRHQWYERHPEALRQTTPDTDRRDSLIRALTYLTVAIAPPILVAVLRDAFGWFGGPR